MLQVYCRNIKVTIAQRGERDRRGKGRTSCVASIRDAACLASKSPEPPPARTSGRPHPAAPSHPVPNISYDMDHYFTTSRQMGYNP